ncbi:hypothetical protein C0989_007851 [Termitomyces sp. Mn162]|nr:hypothetical protein C0989_007851 [Termitomyces sp. Mn162]
MSSSFIRSTYVAPIFLTRPFLFLGIKPAVVSAITTFLQEFLRVSGEESQTLKFQPATLPSLPEIAAFCNSDTTALIKAYFGHVSTVDRASVASANLAVPIPLALACHFFGIVWNDWFMSLGGSEFELVLNPRCVYVVKKSDNCIGVVWNDMNISTGVIRPSVIASIHPTSTYLSSPVDNPDSDADTNTSRPSSRSSNNSTFSFSSHSSASSQSSIESSFGSFDAIPKPKPFTAFLPAKTSAFFTGTTTTHSDITPITNTRRATLKLSITPSAPAKAVPTKYLYQGGMSSVLTGGVMLGNPT